MVTKTKEKKPAYQKIKERLKEDILLGKLKKSLSESQVIYQFKVSPTTARRVLNELEDEGLLERKVGKGSIVISPSENSIKELGVIFFDIFSPNQPFVFELVKGIEEKSVRKNYQLHLYTTRNKPISQNHKSSLFYLITKRKIDGLFILSPIPSSDILFFQKEKIPCVVVGNNYPDIEVPTVMFDSKKAIKEIGIKLLKYGYKKIGLITGPKKKNGIQRSGFFDFLGYKEFLKENNRDYDEKLVKEKEHSEEQGYSAMKEFYILSQKDRPDAVIVASPPAGKGALRFVEENKDWQPFLFSYADEEINCPSYVLVPYKEEGKYAFELLEKQMKDYSAKPEKILVPLKII